MQRIREIVQKIKLYKTVYAQCIKNIKFQHFQLFIEHYLIMCLESIQMPGNLRNQNYVKEKKGSKTYSKWLSKLVTNLRMGLICLGLLHQYDVYENQNKCWRLLSLPQGDETETITCLIVKPVVRVSKHERKQKEIYLKVVRGPSLTLISFLQLLFLN